MDDGIAPHDSETSASATQRVNRAGGGSRPEHRRSKSGSILGNFLRSSKDAMSHSTPSTVQEGAGEGLAQDAEGAMRRPSIAAALRQSQGRPRKGSLRKAAMAKMRERSSSLRKERIAAKPPTITMTTSADSPDGATPTSRSSYEKEPLNSSSDSGWLPAISLSQSTSPAPAIDDPPDEIRRDTPQLLASPMISPAGPYASTTDEDDVMSFYRPTTSSSDFNFNSRMQAPAISLSHRRSTRTDRRLSAASVQTPADIDLDEEWDYSETEWWGWVVLIVTWVVFVVGMGSCLGIWSWAWDVGETPYAPPDLEDDDTLPITGYYPALIVCTAVMSWVWVVIAWVGMKYFRHAKVGVDG